MTASLATGHRNPPSTKHGFSLGTRTRVLVPWCGYKEWLSGDDAADLKRIRDQRDALAHDLPSVIFGTKNRVDLQLPYKTRDLALRVGRFRARVDIDIDEDFDGREITDEEIQPGASIMLEYITQIAVDALDRDAA